MPLHNYADDFPIFSNQSIIYLDNAATTQKPKTVLDAVMQYYTIYCANTHRGMHNLGNKATREYEDARAKIASFVGAEHDEIVFTKGTTESINLVASSYVKQNFKTVIISELEHHSNIVPWQLIGFTKADGLKIIPVDNNLNIDMTAYESLVKNNPKSFISITHVSNSFGIANPVKEMISLAHQYGCTVMIDGAQAVAHMPLNMKKLDADFYAFSGHKMYGPTGIGALYGKKELLLKMPPYHGGGTMIESVTFEKSTYLTPPHRFEAGTQPIAQAIGLGAAADYISSVGFENIQSIDKELMKYSREKLLQIKNIELYTDVPDATGNLSFNIKNIHHSDIGTLLDKQNVFLRTGHHCAMPIMKKLGIDGTVRLSFALYNDCSDIDKTMKALDTSIGILQ